MSAAGSQVHDSAAGGAGSMLILEDRVFFVIEGWANEEARRDNGVAAGQKHMTFRFVAARWRWKRCGWR